MAICRLLMLVMWLTATPGVAQTLSKDALTSIAIDPALFREGAIKRFSGTYEAWNYVCDEVAKMKKRFCSLRTTVKDGEGKVLAAVTISTGEDGRPAALLRMAATSFDERGIEVWSKDQTASAGLKPIAAETKDKTKPSVKTSTKVPVAMKLYPAACEGDVCQMVWTLSPDQIGALSSGAGLGLRYTTPTPGISSLAAGLTGSRGRPVEVLVGAAGFAAAVEASVKPME